MGVAALPQSPRDRFQAYLAGAFCQLRLRQHSHRRLSGQSSGCRGVQQSLAAIALSGRLRDQGFSPAVRGRSETQSALHQFYTACYRCRNCTVRLLRLFTAQLLVSSHTAGKLTNLRSPPPSCCDTRRSHIWRVGLFTENHLSDEASINLQKASLLAPAYQQCLQCEQLAAALALMRHRRPLNRDYVLKHSQQQ